MYPIFPLEIFNLTIIQVAQAGSGTKDLCSCSLVCQDFLSLCRPHIFKRLSIRLTADASFNKVELWRLLDIVNANPALKDYVQEISYTHTKGVVEDAIDLALPGPGSELAAFLCLPNVHCLEIRSDDTWYIEYETYCPNTFNGRALVEHYMASGKLTRLLLNRVLNPPLIPILSGGTLVELDIQDVEFSTWDPQDLSPLNNHPLRKLRCQGVHIMPLSMIRYFSNLEDLQIRYCSEGLDEEDFPSDDFRIINLKAPLQLGRLRSLTTSSDVDWRAILGGHGDVKALPALTDLVVELQDDNMERVNIIVDHIDDLEKLEVTAASSVTFSLFRAHSYISDMHGTLKWLKITIEWGSTPVETVTTLVDVFSSQPQHALEYLSLHVTFCIFDIPAETVTTPVDAFLSQPQHDLDFLELCDPHIGGNAGGLGIKDTVDSIQSAWQALVDVLVESDRFPRLRKLELNIKFKLEGFDDFDSYRDDMFESCVTGPLRDRGLFDIETRNLGLDFWVDVVRPEA